MAHNAAPHWRRKGTCVTGKKRFRYKEQVVDFLHYAANARRDADELGAETTHRAFRSYECRLCNGFHVTSQEKIGA
jgi:hypothetical protein